MAYTTFCLFCAIVTILIAGTANSIIPNIVYNETFALKTTDLMIFNLTQNGTLSYDIKSLNGTNISVYLTRYDWIDNTTVFNYYQKYSILDTNYATVPKTNYSFNSSTVLAIKNDDENKTVLIRCLIINTPFLSKNETYYTKFNQLLSFTIPLIIVAILVVICVLASAVYVRCRINADAEENKEIIPLLLERDATLNEFNATKSWFKKD